eukprot:2666446-Amphidinium_carterae.1
MIVWDMAKAATAGVSDADDARELSFHSTQGVAPVDRRKLQRERRDDECVTPQHFGNAAMTQRHTVSCVCVARIAEEAFLHPHSMLTLTGTMMSEIEVAFRHAPEMGSDGT